MREKDPEKIKKIYGATLKLVNEEGLDAINMSKIAKEAKIASGTLYIYFENKEVLLNELYSHVCDLWLQSVDLTRGNSDFRENLYRIWNSSICFAFDNFEEMKFKMLFLHSRYMDKANREKSSSLLEIFYGIFEEAREKKMIKDIDGRLVYSIIESAMFQVINHLKERGSFDQKTAEDGFLFCWHGIRN